MSKLEERPRRICPKCGMRTGTRHCKSPTCTWNTCNKCQTYPSYVVISDKNAVIADVALDDKHK